MIKRAAKDEKIDAAKFVEIVLIKNIDAYKALFADQSDEMKEKC